MKIAILDTFSGLSGDMMIGGLISAGLPFEYLQRELQKLNLDGYELKISTVQKHSITATKFDVRLLNHHSIHHHDEQHHHNEEHYHDDYHHKDHHHKNSHHHKKPNHENSNHHGRTYSEIINLIEESSLNQNVKEISKRIFKIIGEAEAKIHNVKLEDVHFQRSWRS